MVIVWLYNLKLEQEMRNLACGDQSILLVVILLILRRVDTEKISKWQIGLCIPGIVLGLWGEGAELLEFYVPFSLGGIVAGRFTCVLLWLKSRSVRGASHHPAFIGNCWTISHTLCSPNCQGDEELMDWCSAFPEIELGHLRLDPAALTTSLRLYGNWGYSTTLQT